MKWYNRHTNKTLAQRFWEKVCIKSEEECWNWLAGKHNKGYGYFYTGRKEDRKSEFAHRISYELWYSKPSREKVVMHTCDNTSCVNPFHLKLGTQLDNTKDRDTKGRNKPKIKITKEDAYEIMKSNETNAALAIKFKLDASQISRIRRGKVPYWNKELGL